MALDREKRCRFFSGLTNIRCKLEHQHIGEHDFEECDSIGRLESHPEYGKKPAYIPFDPENEQWCGTCHSVVPKGPHLCVFSRGYVGQLEYAEPTATLRDQFAMAALTGAAGELAMDSNVSVEWAAAITRNAYILADAMLEARKK